MTPLRVVFRKILAEIFSKKDSFLPEKHFIINYSGGKIYLNMKGTLMIKGIIGVYEYWKTKLFFSIIKEGMTCIDAGAHKGYFSLLFAKLMNDKSRVLSFEPYPENCFWLKQSIRVNNFKCIKVYPYALSDNEGMATFYPGKISGWSSLFFNRNKLITKKPIIVKTRKLDNVLKDESINGVDVIKIDVEGAELLVLKGAKNILEKGKNIKLVIEINAKNKEINEQIFELLDICDFQIYRIDKKMEPIKRLDEISKDTYDLSIYATKGDLS